MSAVVGADDPLVYYIRRDGLIKIGYTSKFVNRMRDLRPDELLAVEPGNIPLETGRHLQFAEHRVLDGVEGREWYRPAPELLEHIDRMAATYEAPPLPSFRPPPVPQVPVQRDPAPDSELAAIAFRALRGEVSLDELDVEALIAVGRVAVRGRELVHHATVALNQRGVTFAQIGEHVGAAESTASRWAKPARRPGRRRRARAEENGPGEATP